MTPSTKPDVLQCIYVTSRRSSRGGVDGATFICIDSMHSIFGKVYETAMAARTEVYKAKAIDIPSLSLDM